ncbi:MAG: hypothetical protein JJU28_13245 [Cyclobacteriaceae bacterium]|nr:hypothetical protein [Cyclobacteriaceae bacterium]
MRPLVLRSTLYLSVLSLIWLVSCGPDKKAEDRDALYKSMMQVHDEVMPEMGTISNLQKQIKEKLEGLDENAENYEAEKSELEDLHQDLKNAHDGMMMWMRQLKRGNDLEQMPHDEVVAYLKDEYEKISEVKDMMLQSINDAKNYLNK